MNDNTREEFEKTGFFGNGALWIKWDGRKYIKECNGHNKTADRWAESCNRELSIYEAGSESRDAEIKELQQILKDSIVNESHWKHCPDCPDEGYYISGSGEEPEQVQCQFCYTEQWSVFNQKRIRQTLKESE